MRRDLRNHLTPPASALFFKGWMPYLLLLIAAIVACLPWSMYSSGAGRVTATDPNERLQEINAPVSGFIRAWRVTEGSRVRKGEPVVELVDSDPSLIHRMERERRAGEMGVESSELALRTARINLDRQKQLLDEGLTARKEYEKAKIEVSKLAVELSKSQSTLAKAETQVSRQNMQSVVAPRDGVVIRILHGEGNQLVKSGDSLLVFAPDVTTPAVELWISGNDMRFTQVGQPVRVQFEGWPSVQVPGWPSVAIGTFKGQVRLVDHATVNQGKFRVLVTPADGHPWPSTEFLRPNANARGVVVLGDTFVAREVWRQLNNFPPTTEPFRDELGRTLASAKKTGKKPAASDAKEEAGK